MITQRYFFKRPRLWGLLCGLILAVAQLLTPAGVNTAKAATTTVVRDGPSCVAAGGTYTASIYDCAISTINIAAGNTLELISSSSISVFRLASVTNNGTFKVASAFVYVTLLDNKGTTELVNSLTIRGRLQNDGTVNVRSGAGLVIDSQATLINNRTITVFCGGGITNNGTITGTQPQYIDCTAPTASPNPSPRIGTNGWVETDVTVYWAWRDNTGGSGIDRTRCLDSSSSSGEGVKTLTATCYDRAGNVGSASYTFKVDKTPPVAKPTHSPAANAAGWNNTNVTVNWNWTDPVAGTVAGSGIDTTFCPTSVTSRDNGVLTFNDYCADLVGNLTNHSYIVKVDKARPQILATINPPANGLGWHNSAATVSFTCQEWGDGSGLATNTVGGNVTMNSEGTYPAVTNTGSCVDLAGNVAPATTAGPFNLDMTKPTISAAATTPPNANGWYNSAVTVRFTCADALSGAILCPTDQVLSNEGSAISSTAQTVRDQALNTSDPSNLVTVKLDKTAPVVTLTGVTNGATYPFSSVPTATCNTTDALAGVATLATLSVTGGNGSGGGTFTATCSPATDLAGNSSAPVSVNYTVETPPTPTPTAVPPTPTPTAVPPTPTPTAVPDACLATARLDDFNRPDGNVGSYWAGMTDLGFYKLTSNQMDVQLGGPVIWNSTPLGVEQAAFVTLSTPDLLSTAQGVLLKVQDGLIPSAGAIAVVYDGVARAVRVATIQPPSIAWSAYPNVPVTIVNGDKLVGCAYADGKVRIYQNTTLLTTVTLNAADQSFFNAKGGKIGLWTVTALNAFFDDFGGGNLPGVAGAALGENPAAQQAAAPIVVDSVLITASVPLSAPPVAPAPVAETAVVTTTQPAITDTAGTAPVDANAPAAPDTSEQNQRLFLPIITNMASLAGAALGGAGSMVALVVIGLVVIGLIWQRRQRSGR